MDNLSTLDPPEGVSRFYPIRQHTQREIDAALAHCGVMCADYERHYGELLGYMKTYLQTKDRVNDYPLPTQLDDIEPLSLQELETRVTVAVGVGFYVLSPKVALYFMAKDPTLFIDCAEQLLRDTSIRWGVSAVAVTVLLTTLLTAFAEEHVCNDYESYLKELIKDLPIHSPAYLEQLFGDVKAVLSQRPSPRTLH